MSSYLCRHDAVKHICVRHIVTVQSSCDVRDVGPAVAQYGLGFNILKWLGLKIKFQIVSKRYLT
jgi:hypothetical protein